MCENAIPAIRQYLGGRATEARVVIDD